MRESSGRATTDHDVVIAGGGPTGLMLAGELALAGVDVAIVEPRTSQHVESSRAGGLYPRTIEVLDQRGIAERFVSVGQKHPVLGYAQIMLDVSDLPTRHAYVLALWQSRFEPILADWVAELGVPNLRGREVVGSSQDDHGVSVEISDETVLRAQYLVGCDGGRSTVRRAAGIEFAGWDASTSWMIAEVRAEEQPELGVRYDDVGIQAIGPAGDAESFRVVLTERSVGHGVPTIDELRAAMVAVHGTDYGLSSVSWISRFTDAARQAASYRRGRVLLAGDAAHVHPPHGGQGLNTGVQDAVNLGWKLAQVVDGTSPDDLLDTYHAERHPVGARVLQHTMALVALSGGGDRHQALRDAMAELLVLDEPRRRLACALAGLDIHYDVGGDHPLCGRRMPDVGLVTAEGPTRVSTLLHEARPVLLDLTEHSSLTSTPRRARVRVVEAACDDRWELPVLGPVAAPGAVLIRPDGHVAWAGDPGDRNLPRVLTRWFGSAGAA